MGERPTFTSAGIARRSPRGYEPLGWIAIAAIPYIIRPHMGEDRGMKQRCSVSCITWLCILD